MRTTNRRFFFFVAVGHSTRPMFTAYHVLTRGVTRDAVGHSHHRRLAGLTVEALVLAGVNIPYPRDPPTAVHLLLFGCSPCRMRVCFASASTAQRGVRRFFLVPGDVRIAAIPLGLYHANPDTFFMEASAIVDEHQLLIIGFFLFESPAVKTASNRAILCQTLRDILQGQQKSRRRVYPVALRAETMNTSMSRWG